MIIYYLMVKTHRTTGLKYLCQTKNKNPHKYKGSGKYWKFHIHKHGYDVDTHIIVKCYTKAALREWGLYYSKLWSVVESEKWANLMPEAGDGVDGSFISKKRADPNSGYHTESFKKAMGDNGRKMWKDENKRKIAIEKLSSASKKLWESKEYKEKNCERYIITSPGGESFEILNLNEFCRENNLGLGNMWSVSVGRRKSHKGWLCKKSKSCNS